MPAIAPPPDASLELLRHLVEEFSGELELDPLLNRIVEYACRLIGADDGTIGLYDPVRDLIRIAAVYNMPARELGAEMRPGMGLAGHVLASRAPVLGRYGDLAAINLGELADNRVIGIPILWQDELIGFFGIGIAPPREFDEGALDSLTVFARHAAIAIDNARRYARERRRTARFELIERVARIINAGLDERALLQQTADAIHDVLEFPNVDVPLLDQEDPQTLVVAVRGGGYKREIQGEDRLSIERGIMGAAVREARTQRVDDVSRDPRYFHPPTAGHVHAEMAVPIQIGGEVLGVLNVEGNDPFDDLDQRTIEIIADHLAIALQNLRLAEQARNAAVTDERHRLARELHDSVTQILSAISLLSQSLPAAWRADAADGERRAQRLTELSQAAFAEMRALLRELLPSTGRAQHEPQHASGFLGLERLEQGGLAAALPRLLEAVIPEQITLRQDFSGYVKQAIAHEEALFRVCQEAVSNVVRHAGAQCIEVVTEVGPEWVHLRVRDDGCGIARTGCEGGIGLLSMQQRIARLGGCFELLPTTPHGLEVSARLPRSDRGVEA